MENEKISVWIFAGSRSPLSMTFCPRALVFRSLAAVFILFLAVGAVIYSRSQRKPQEESVALLKSYIEKKIKEESAIRENPELKSEIQKEQDEVSEEERSMQAKIRLLVDEFIRVRDYENQLKARATALNNVFNNVLELDPDYLPKLEAEPAGKASDGEQLGVGGVDLPSSGTSSAAEARQSATEGQNEGQYSSMRRTATLRRLPVESKVTKLSRNKDVIELVDTSLSSYDSIPLGTPVEGRVSSAYGKRQSPFSRRIHSHSGIDISVDRRTPVLATADGVVVKAGSKGAYGQAVVIDHGNGIETLYGHMAEVDVKVGDQICRGKRVGFAGSTGRSTGPHVHYEVRIDGAPTDPGPFVQLAGLLKTL